MSKGPALYNLEPFFAAGIDPKTGLPNKITGNQPCNLKVDIKKQLRILDEQNAVNRFTWYNLPDGLTSQLVERILYYRGQAAFFKMGENFYFLPYALDGTIDVYGRYRAITPLPFNGTTTDKDNKPLIEGLTYDCVYEVMTPDDFIKDNGEYNTSAMENMIEKSAVLLKDYTEQISQTIIPRQQLQEPILDIMSDCLPLMRTALFNSTGVAGLRVGDADEQRNAQLANNSINQAALSGQRYVPIVGQLDFQDLAGGNVAKAEEFLLALQSLDNYRLSLYGLDNGGLFQKKAHMLEAEQEMNNSTANLVYQDSIQRRQAFCNIVNSIWGLGIWCEPNETILGYDKNGSGVIGDTDNVPTQTTEQEAANDDN